MEKAHMKSTSTYQAEAQRLNRKMVPVPKAMGQASCFSSYLRSSEVTAKDFDMDDKLCHPVGDNIKHDKCNNGRPEKEHQPIIQNTRTSIGGSLPGHVRKR